MGCQNIFRYKGGKYLHRLQVQERDWDRSRMDWEKTSISTLSEFGEALDSSLLQVQDVKDKESDKKYDNMGKYE